MWDVYNTDFSKEGYDWDKDAFDFSENDEKRTWARQPVSAWDIIKNTIGRIKALAWKWDKNSDENK